MLLVTRPQSAVFFLRERPPLLTTGFLEQRFSVWEAGTDSRGEVGLGIRIVLFVCVREVGPEPGETRKERW